MIAYLIRRTTSRWNPILPIALPFNLCGSFYLRVVQGEVLHETAQHAGIHERLPLEV